MVIKIEPIIQKFTWILAPTPVYLYTLVDTDFSNVGCRGILDAYVVYADIHISGTIELYLVQKIHMRGERAAYEITYT